MPRRKYDREQQAILDKLAAVHREQVVTKADMRAEIEAAFRARLAEFDVQKSLLANQAVSRGVAKSDVQRAISSGNWDTLRKLLDLTAAQFAEGEKLDETAWRYDYDSGAMTVRLVDEPWPGVEGGFNGEATFVVTQWGSEYGADHAGKVRMTWTDGDFDLKFLEGARPWGLVQSYVENVFAKNGWQA